LRQYHRTAFTGAFSLTSFIILEIALRSTVEQFGNLGQTFRAKPDHFDRLGLLCRREFIASTADL
jgi:hypothetical protein